MVWDYSQVTAPQRYGDDDISYERAMLFLDQPDFTIEDWGCGTAYARQFVHQGQYRGIDWRPSLFCDLVEDLRLYRSRAEAILLRHVLEHNEEWQLILYRVMLSFQHRLCLVLFTPMSENETVCLAVNAGGIPDLSLDRRVVREFFGGCDVKEEMLPTRTQYGQETIFYVERRSSVGKV